MPDKPFFAYFAPGATHAPHHVPEEWSAKYKGKFDQGWDKLREETFARQKELGVIPPDTRADRPARRDPGVGRHARRPEAGAGPPDGGLRRLPRAHRPPRRPARRRARGPRDPRGHARLLHHRRQRRERRGHDQRHLQRAVLAERRGGARDDGVHERRASTSSARPTAYNHYAVGWAHAMDTPYQWTKQVASHWGGTRNGTIVHWPNGIKAKGEVRTQFHHVIDVAPTVLEAAGLPEPSTVNGVQQKPIEGVSMRYTFDDAGAAERHETQYFEMFCNRGIYHKGWTAVTRHSTPWVVGDGAARLRRRRLGALRHQHRLDPGARPRRRAAGEARRAAAAVADRGRQVQRPAARRPPRRTLQPRSRRRPRSSRATRSSCSAAWAGCPRTRSSTSRTSRTR